MLYTMHFVLLAVAAGLGCMVYQGRRRDPQEPPFLPSKIPVIGHILGMIFQGLRYWRIFADENPEYPIFTLDMLFMKVYVVSSPDIVRLIQRNEKSESISFDPLLDVMLKAVGIEDKRTEHIMRDKSSGGMGLNAEIMHSLTPTLIGKPLDQMNSSMMQTVKTFIDDLEINPAGLDLYRWVRDVITAASTNATYGPLNPYKDPEVVDAFWDFESNLSSLFPNFLPWLTARTALNGRKRVARAIQEYMQNNGIENASELAKIRYQKAMEHDISVEEYVRLEVPMQLAFVSNTVPAAFWALFDLYSKPELLEEFREEIKQNALSISADGTHIVNITSIKETCPFAMSLFQEILRWHTTTSPTRSVLSDTMLGDKYLLKKGATISMPGYVIGKRPEVWGESAEEFDPRRFIKPDPSKTGPQKKEPRRTGGFMPFGISPVICPGRHFASSEVLGIAAMMVLRYDLNPMDGIWKAPPTDTTSLVSIMGAVREKFPVDVRTRDEFKGVKWGFHCETGKGQFTLAVG